MECRTSPTPGIWVHWSGAYGPLMQGLLLRPRWQGREGMSRYCPEQQACLHPIHRLECLLVSYGCSEIVTLHHTETQVSTTVYMYVDKHIAQAVVAYDDISPHACRSLYSMVTGQKSCQICSTATTT